MVYAIVVFFLLFFLLQFDIKKETKNKKFCYYTLLVAFILIAGLRYRLGVDTTRYITRFYHETPLLWELSLDDLSYGKDPLYTILNSLVLSFGGRFYIVQLIHAAFVNILIFKYIEKHSQYVFMCVFFYFIWQFCPLNMEEMRASMSIVICLFANDYMLEKKWVKGLFLYLLGCLFHSSTIIILLVVPMLFFLRANKFGFILLASVFIIGGLIRPLLEDYLTLFALTDSVENKVSGYVQSDEMMERNLNIKGLAVNFALYLYSIVSLLYIKRNNPNCELVKNESLLMIFLVFALLSLQITIVYRFTRFYFIYYLFFVSHISVILFEQNRNMSRSLVYFRAILIISPLIFVMVMSRIGEDTYPRYHPYNSVIEKGIDSRRERLFSSFNGDRAVYDEY